MDMGSRIKELRLLKNLTQEDLGDLVGVQKAAVQKWESGLVKNLKRSTIAKLAKLFEVQPSYLLGIEDDDTVVKEEAAPYHTIDSFQDPVEAMKFILQQPVFMRYGGYDLNTMDDDEVVDIANDLLIGLKVSIERRRRKGKG